MERFTIVARPDDLSRSLEQKAQNTLEDHGFIRDDHHPDTVIIIGGDGTFIYAVHQYLEQLDDVRFFGIHTGTLGFYTDYKDDEIEEFLDVLVSDRGYEVQFPMLRAEVGNKRYYALNEIRIENAARTQVMEVSINGDHLETFRGTGMLVCTQLGSTAYNRSLGGAVIQDGLDLIELVEISGIHHSKYRSLDAPFVLRPDSVIEFETNSYDGALLGVDSDVYPLDGETHVEVKICTRRHIRVLRGKKTSYFEKLKSLF